MSRNPGTAVAACCGVSRRSSVQLSPSGNRSGRRRRPLAHPVGPALLNRGMDDYRLGGGHHRARGVTHPGRDTPRHGTGPPKESYRLLCIRPPTARGSRIAGAADRLAARRRARRLVERPRAHETSFAADDEHRAVGRRQPLGPVTTVEPDRVELRNGGSGRRPFGRRLFSTNARAEISCRAALVTSARCS